MMPDQISATWLAVQQSGFSLGAFLVSFLAILLAGIIIARFNYELIKKERWCQTADKFCVNLESFIYDYFDNVGKEEGKEADRKFLACLDAFIAFLDGVERWHNKKEIANRCDILLELSEGDINEEERIRGTLYHIAVIRNYLT